MDGNDSLKRIIQYLLGEDGQPLHICEAIDSRSVDDSLYRVRQEVDKWADEAFEDLMGDNFSEVCALPRSPAPSNFIDRIIRTLTTTHVPTAGKI